MVKIAVLSSYGGHGHTVSVSALQQLLGDRYDFVTYHPFNELKAVGFTHWDSLYNFFLERGRFRAIGLLSRWPARLFLRLFRQRIEEQIGAWLDREQPDLVISLIPYINFSGWRAAASRGLNYLLITLDYDLRNWVEGLDKVEHTHFAVTIGRNSSASSGRLLEKGIPPHLIYPIGLPLRAQFTHARVETNAPIPTILLTLGGRGTNATFAFAEKILSLNLPLHLVVIAGHNEELYHHLQSLSSPRWSQYTVLGLVDDIATWMARANLIVLKPGPLTLTEAMALHKPVLMDCTHGVLPWERANIRMVQEYGLGRAIRRLSDLSANTLLTLPEPEIAIENRFAKEIGPLIASLLKR